LAPEEESNPGLTDLTTPEYAAKCGMCHPGGGPMEKDRKDNFLYQKNLSEIQQALDSGKLLGDYIIWSKTEKRFIPFEWKVDVNGQKINNTAAPTCFYCHSKKALQNGIDTAATATLMFRLSLLGKLTGKHYFAASDTLGGLLGNVNPETGEINYDLTLFDGNKLIGDYIVGKSDYSCGHCHGVFQFEDFDNDGKITPLDFIKAAKDPKFMHPDGMKEALIWQFNIGVETDVHRLNGKGCTDCHAPVKHEYIGSGYYPSSPTLVPSHDFAKGNSGPAFGVRWSQLAGSATCENCHDGRTIHEGIFGPPSYTDIHLQKVACTTCHIGKKYFYRVKLIDWSLPLLTFSGTPVEPSNATAIASTITGLDKHGYLYGDPINGKWEDIALFPERNFKTGEVKWKYKPANAMGVLLFEDNSSGEFKPVFARYLAKAFKLNPNLPTKYLKVEIDPSTGKPKRVDGAIDPETGKPIKILNIKAVKGGKIAEDPDLLSGQFALWRATPNYIDINLNGAYDEGTDIPILDDTGLTGAPDGDPEINTKTEVEAAIITLKKVIESATGKNVDVKLVATADAFGMSHNIKPASRALTCADCHGKSESAVLSGPLFTQTTPLYFEYDAEVTNANYFEAKIERTPTQIRFAEFVQEELIKAGYPAPEEATSEETEPSQPQTQEPATGGGGGCSMASTTTPSNFLSFLTLVFPLLLLKRRNS